MSIDRALQCAHDDRFGSDMFLSTMINGKCWRSLCIYKCVEFEVMFLKLFLDESCFMILVYAKCASLVYHKVIIGKHKHENRNRRKLCLRSQLSANGDRIGRKLHQDRLQRP